MQISAVINVKNNAVELKRCLASLKFCHEVVVVDMESTDNTMDIASQFGAQVYQHPDVGYADPARNFAIEQAQHDWILVVDADEEIPASLAKTITSLVRETTAQVIWLPRLNYIFGEVAQYGGWWPDYQPRLFRKGHVLWQVGVHKMPEIIGQEYYFPPRPENAIIHHNYVSVSHFIEKLNRYTTLQAVERQPTHDTPTTGADIVHVFRNEIFRRLFADKGITGGTHGVGLSFLQALYEVTIGLKMWERRSDPARTYRDQEATLSALKEFTSDMHYWIANARMERSVGLKKLYWQFRKKLKI